VAGADCLYSTLCGFDLSEVLRALEEVLGMSQLVSQHLGESLDLGETFEADEGIDRIRSRTRPSELEVPGAEPDDCDVAETRGVDELDMEHSDLPRSHLERGEHLDVNDVS